jgi:hypothetical protein
VENRGEGCLRSWWVVLGKQRHREGQKHVVLYSLVQVSPEAYSYVTVKLFVLGVGFFLVSMASLLKKSITCSQKMA